MTVTEARESALSVPMDNDPLAGIRIIDCDSHFTEPPDLWTSRAPAKFRDRMPVQRTTAEGITAWYHNDELWTSTGGNNVARGKEKVYGTIMLQPFDRIDKSAWSVKERLALLDEIGLYAQILYPNGLGFSSNHIFAIEDQAERMEILRIYNDFLVEIQHESGGRLLPQAMIPIWDMDATIKEMTRMLDQGITGFTLTDRPQLTGLPELPEPYFTPMWDLFNSSGAVANFHVGAGMRREDQEALRSFFAEGNSTERTQSNTFASSNQYGSWRSLGVQRSRCVLASLQFMSNLTMVANFCMSDIFDRHENLKIVSAESGIGWVPFLLEQLEWQYEELVRLPQERAFAKNRPTENFRQHIYVMFWFEESAPAHLLEDIGVGNVLVESDFPHPTCLYPSTRDRLARAVSSVAPEVRQRVLQDNAAELYGVDLNIK